MGKRLFLVLIALVVVAVAAVIGVQRWRSTQAAEEDATETAVVERKTLRVTVGGNGSLVPAEEVSASFTNSGEVAEVLVAVGDTVGAGQSLAVLDTRALELDVASAEAAVVSAESSLSAARAQAADVLDGASEGEIAEARMNIDQAKDRLWGSQAQRDGICGRVARKQGQQYECDGANASVLQNEGSVRLAELQLATLLEGAEEVEVTAARDKVTQAETGLASARTKLAAAQLKMEEATLTSPITGTVTAVNVIPGETAGGGSSAAMVISRLDDMEVEILLDETDVGGVEVGQPAVVTMDAFPDQELSGSVTRVAPVASVESGVVLFPVTVSIEPTELDLRPGMTADVELVLESVADALVVPLRALVSTPRGSFVMRVGIGDASAANGTDGGFAARRFGAGPGIEAGDVISAPLRGAPPGAMPFGDGTARASGAFGQRAMAGLSQLATGEAVPIPVEVGLVSDTEAEIVSGLAEGDVVVVTSRTSGNQFGGPGGMPRGDMFIMGRP